EDSSTTQDDIVQIPVSPIILTADTDENSITVGTSQNISFTAEGGTGQYIWDMNFSNANDIDKFEFSSFGRKGVLSYNGGTINSKTITILVQDGYGNFDNTIISVNNSENTLTLVSDSESESDKFSIGISDTIVFTASGGAGEYIWGISYTADILPESFIFSSAGNSGVLIYTGAIISSGTITVIVKDEIGMSAHTIITVNSPESNIQIEMDLKEISVGTKESIGFGVEGGIGEYTWQIEYSSDIEKNSFSFLKSGQQAALSYDGGLTSSGTITIIVKDELGATAHEIITINSDETAILLDASADGFSIGTPGSILISAFGGTGRYTWKTLYSSGLNQERFIFSSSEKSATLAYDGSATSSGNITLVVEDEQGKSGQIVFTISSQESNIQLQADSTGFVVGVPGGISFNASGGKGVYFWNAIYSDTLSSNIFSFSGSGNSGSLTYDGRYSQSGTITVVVQDELGASARSIVIVATSSLSGIQIEADASSFSVGTPGNIEFIVKGGTNNYQWNLEYLSGTVNKEKFTFSSSGDKAALVYDGGITSIGSMKIKVNDELNRSTQVIITINDPEESIRLEADGNSFSIGTPGSILINAFGGTARYVWKTLYSSGLNQERFIFSSSEKSATLAYDGSAASSGNITLVVEDEQGKSGQIVFTISNQESKIQLQADSNDFVVGVPGGISFNVSGGNGEYQWNTEYSDTLSSDAFQFSDSGNSGSLTYGGRYSSPGTITVRVTDELGASAQKIIVVNSSESSIQLAADGEKFSIGIPKIILFTTSGGTDNYEWRISYSSKLETNSFSFSASGGSGTLIYDGGNTGTGEIIVAVKDEDNNISEKTIIVSGGDINGVLEIQPETVGIGGKTLCIFNLNYLENALPIPGSNIVFRIEQGAAEFISSAGKKIGTFVEAETDLDGKAYIRIKIDNVEDNIEENTNVIVSAFSDTGVSATKTFSIDRSHGIIEFSGNGNIAWNHNGLMLIGERSWLLNLQLRYTDKDGNPLHHKEVVIDTYLETNSIQDVSFGKEPLSTPIITDDNGIADFVLKVSLFYDRVEEHGIVRIGSLVLTGTGDNGTMGSFAIAFDSFTLFSSLSIEPVSKIVSAGQTIGLNANGGTSPYKWLVNGEENTADIVDEKSFLYTTPDPAVSAIITVVDAAGSSVSANISPKE
ncbi:hypothetical protein QUF70_06540, partial [Desulfobacterales bacterium HSG17]|nr:hypothetical protein [Desulfobacterales bacterium HSG17]